MSESTIRACVEMNAQDQLEKKARVLRERIYGPISDLAWDKIKHNWAGDIVWLERTAGAGLSVVQMNRL